MSKVLVISGHPDLDASFANRIILEDLQAEFGPSIEVRRLDRLYPDFRIDVAAEQKALIEADIIVWQFPLYWYALPALMKKWVDDVLVRGFAHGSSGSKLRGKKLVASFTTGADGKAYAHGQPMNFTVAEFLPPLQQTALLCGMEWRNPTYSNGMIYIPGVSGDTERAMVEARAHNHAHKLANTLRTLAAQPVA